MLISALGTGNASTLRNFHTNFLIRRNDKHLLVDCGGDLRRSLGAALLKDLKLIDAIYISHLHADHVGGLEDIGFGAYFSGTRHKLIAHQSILEALPAMMLPGMGKITNQEATLSTYWDLLEVQETFEWEGVTFHIVPQVHVEGDPAMMSYGLIFKDPDEGGEMVYITTDVAWTQEHEERLLKTPADLIIHDCETTAQESGVHCHFDRLKTLPEGVRRRMKLIHYADNVLLSCKEWVPLAEELGFQGFAETGAILYMPGGTRTNGVLSRDSSRLELFLGPCW